MLIEVELKFETETTDTVCQKTLTVFHKLKCEDWLTQSSAE